ncbi:hypothetical protein MPTK2_8g03100 [Marchantia polymorpha subsp. ruderalis]
MRTKQVAEPSKLGAQVLSTRKSSAAKYGQKRTEQSRRGENLKAAELEERAGAAKCRRGAGRREHAKGVATKEGRGRRSTPRGGERKAGQGRRRRSAWPGKADVKVRERKGKKGKGAGQRSLRNSREQGREGIESGPCGRNRHCCSWESEADSGKKEGRRGEGKGGEGREEGRKTGPERDGRYRIGR